MISGESLEELNGYGSYRPRNIISTILGGTPSKVKHLWISNPQDFRQVKLNLNYFYKSLFNYFLVRYLRL